MLNFWTACTSVCIIMVFVTHFFVDDSEIIECDPTQPILVHVRFLYPTAHVLVSL